MNDIYHNIEETGLKNNAILKIVPNTYDNLDAVNNTITYVSSHTIENGYNGIGCSPVPENAISDFYRTKTIFQKNNSSQVRHIIIAFTPSTFIKANIYNIAWDIAYFFYLAGFQVFYGIHELQNSLHIHIIHNTINFINGNRYAPSPMAKQNFIDYIDQLPYEININSTNNSL